MMGASKIKGNRLYERITTNEKISINGMLKIKTGMK